MLPGEAGERIALEADGLLEVRLRSGRPVQLRRCGGDWLSRETVSPDMLNRVLASLMDHSLYAREEELGQGFFTMSDGSRVGVCGRLVWNGQRVTGMAGTGSICVRISREIKGCADDLLEKVSPPTGGIHSTLIISGPGLGKTTLLREVARCLSNGGHNVCIADERHEIAACVNGVPTLDVGLRTDVMDGAPKAVAIPHLMRASAPEVIIADEIGCTEDAAVLADAVRCGVCVISTAHAGSFDQLMARRSLRQASKLFELVVLLGGMPGNIIEVREGWHASGAGAVRGGGMYAVRKRRGDRITAQGGDIEGTDPGTACPTHPHGSDA